MNTYYSTDARQSDDTSAAIAGLKGSTKDKQVNPGDDAVPQDDAATSMGELLQGWLGKAKGLPALLEAELKDNPYKVLAIMGAAGMGLGILVGSRLVRALVLSTGSYAITEILRAYAKELIGATDTTTHP